MNRRRSLAARGGRVTKATTGVPSRLGCARPRDTDMPRAERWIGLGGDPRGVLAPARRRRMVRRRGAPAGRPRGAEPRQAHQWVAVVRDLEQRLRPASTSAPGWAPTRVTTPPDGARAAARVGHLRQRHAGGHAPPSAGHRAPSGSVAPRPATGARSTAARSVSGTTSPGIRPRLRPRSSATTAPIPTRRRRPPRA